MNCPHCQSVETSEYSRKTSLGYRIYKCHRCERTFNERTGTVFNHLQFPTDIVMLVVMGRIRYKLSLRDLVEMFLVREWEARCAPELSQALKAKRRGQAGKSWYVDDTYVKVNGEWHYLYRAIDRDGNLVDTMLSPTRDLQAAEAFFKQAVVTVGHKPERVTTDGNDTYPRAIRRVLGRKVVHRTNKYLNNRLEQDHRTVATPQPAL